MKKAIRVLIVSAFLMTAPLILLAQNPPHPNGGVGPGSGNTPVGGGAPIGGGLIIMLALGMGYGVKNVFKGRQKLSE